MVGRGLVPADDQEVVDPTRPRLREGRVERWDSHVRANQVQQDQGSARRGRREDMLGTRPGARRWTAIRRTVDANVTLCVAVDGHTLRYHASSVAPHHADEGGGRVPTIVFQTADYQFIHYIDAL